MQEAIIVVTEDEESARAAEELIRRWSATGLLKPVYWIVAETGAQSDDDLAIPTGYIDRGTVRDVDLLAHLALRTVSGARVIAFVLADGIGDTQIVGDRAEWIFDVLRRQGGLPVHRLAVLVPVTGSAAVGDEAVIREGWSVVVVSPEDRPRDEQRSFARPITRADSLASHGAFALCVNGGLWAAMADGPFDGGGAFASGGQADLRVARAFGRLIFGDQVLEAVVARTLTIPSRWPAPVEVDTRIPVAGEPAAVIQRLTDDLMAVSDGALTYAPFSAAPVEPDRLPTIRQILTRFFRFVVRNPGDLRTDLKSAQAERAEALARHLALGDGATNDIGAVAAGSRSVAEMGVVATRILDATRVAVAGAEGVAVAAPEVWRAVHATAFGLVDGSPMPAGVGPVRMADGTGVVVTEADLVVPAADDGFRVELDDLPEEWRQAEEIPDEIGFLDAFTSRRLRRLLGRPAQQWIDATSDPDGGAGADPEPDAPPAAPPPAAPPPAADAPAGDTAAADTAAGSSTDTADEPSPAPRAAATTGAGRVTPPSLFRIEATTAAELRRLDAWEARRRGSLLWGVADRTARSVEQSLDDILGALQVLAAGVPDPDREALAAARRRARRGVAWTGLATLLAVIATIVVGAVGIVTVPWAIVLAVVSLLAGVGTAFLFFLRYFRLEQRLVEAPKRAARAFEAASERLIHATRGLIQVSSHYVQLLRWAEVIARMVRSPWAPLPAATPSDRSDLETPLALSISTGLASTDLVDALVGRAGRAVFRRGWLTESYRALVHHVEKTYRTQYAVDVVPAAETDRPQVQVETMDMLIDATRNGSLHDQEFRRLRKAVVDTLNEQPLERLFDECEQVGRVEGYTEDQVVMAAEEFLTDVLPHEAKHNFVTNAFESGGVVEFKHRVSAHRIWATDEIPLGDAADIQIERASRSADVAGIYSLLLRLDVSEPLSRDDVSLFAQAMLGVAAPDQKARPEIPEYERD